MIDPNITVITPSYNQAEFLEENIQSVKEQDYPGVEHIVVDGGSTDGTLEILQKYENRYNLRWISESDRGQSHALNKGLELATGNWIGWQNSDDFYLPGAFEALVDTVQSHRDSKLVYGDLLIVDKSGKEIDRKYCIPPSRLVQRYWSIYTSNQCTFFHRSIFDHLGGFDEDYTYTMDNDLFWRIAQEDYNYAMIHKFIGAIRMHLETKTAGHPNVDIEKRREIRKIYGTTWYENLISGYLLRNMAKILKGLYLLRCGRMDALKWYVTEKF